MEFPIPVSLRIRTPVIFSVGSGTEAGCAWSGLFAYFGRGTKMISAFELGALTAIFFSAGTGMVLVAYMAFRGWRRR